jgi:anthranilate phosphoribosyltransferase
MQIILEGRIHPVQTAVFLIALRMKRETDDENRGILDAIRQTTRFATARVDELVEIADPYDGFARHLPASPFLPAVLAACGVPTVSHGVKSVGPKFGLTHHQVLSAAGIDIDLSPGEAAERISDPETAWAYVDQCHYSPALYGLVELRNLIVKRPCIATLEVMAGPVRSAGRSHLVHGYVHSGYKRIYIELARFAGYHSACIIKGIEGGIVPLLNKKINCVGYRDTGDKSAREFELDPTGAGVITGNRAVPLSANDQYDPIEKATTVPPSVLHAARLGLEALQGVSGLTRDSLIYTAAACLVQIQRFSDLRSAAQHVGEVIDNGRALAHFRNLSTTG